MMRRLTVAALFTTLSLGATALASPEKERTLTVEKGRLKILHLPFEAAASAGTNSSVVEATFDLDRNRIFFVAREVGEATYTLSEGEGESARKIQVKIRVVEPTDG